MGELRSLMVVTFFSRAPPRISASRADRPPPLAGELFLAPPPKPPPPKEGGGGGGGPPRGGGGGGGGADMPAHKQILVDCKCR